MGNLSCLENPMGEVAWWAAVHSVAMSRTWLSIHFHFSLACIGGGNGNPLQYSCLENPRDRGAWWAAVYGVAQSQTRLKWLSSSSSSMGNLGKGDPAGASCLKSPFPTRLREFGSMLLAQWRFNYGCLGVGGNKEHSLSPAPKQTPRESERNFSITT